MIKQLFIVQVILLSFQVITYFGCELLQHNPHNVKRSIDDRVPLKPAWVYVYVMWFPLIFFFPFYLYFMSEKHYIIYMIAILTDIVLSTIIYVAYPTSFDRKKPDKDFFGKSLQFIYIFSFKGYNCAPSMHCSMCFIIMALTMLCPGIPLLIKLALIGLSIAIVMATQFTKQHVLIDATTGLIIAIVAVISGNVLNSVYGTQVLLSLLGL